MDLKLIEEVIQRSGSRYRAVLMAARRAKQIQKGSQPTVESKGKKPIATAMEEISADKVKPLEESEISPADDFNIMI